jgi:hypothetical protein
MPLLVCVAELDTEADPELAKKIAKHAPHGELKTYPVRHFDVYVAPTFLDMVTDQLEFLRRALPMPTEGRSSDHPSLSAG